MAQKQTWDAKHYDQNLAFVSKYGEDVLTLLNAQPNEHILDLGCGSGHLTSKIASMSGRATGLDYSAQMIEKAKANYPNLHFIVADAQNFTLPEQVDSVFSNAALHWMKKPESVLRSIKHVLKDEGKFVAEFGGQYNVAIVIKAIEDVLLELYNIDAKVLNPWYFPSIAQYSSVLEQEGFYVQYIEHMDRPTPMVDGEYGLFHWLNGFGSLFFASLTTKQKEECYALIAKKTKSQLYVNNTWYIDYKRIRVVAYSN